jgi:cyclic pyranopterin phosphate synthase
MSDAKKLSHVDATGRVTMVDVGAKAVTRRTARASALVTIGSEAFAQLTGAGMKKGDALATAQIAGIHAAKKTCDLIPLCHGLMPEFVDVRFELLPPDNVRIWTEARVESKTGVELEALTAASIAALTLYDMCKAVSKGIVIGPIQLEEKTGGRSGDWRRS